MAKIPLNVAEGYLEHWGVYDGAREIFQNSKDAEEFDGYPMTVEHFPRTNRLVVTNEGAVVDPGLLLLMGATSKKGTGARGRFGVGFVDAAVTLLRHEHHVTVHNGDETWRFAFELAETGHFEGRKVFHVLTRKRQSDMGAFVVEIDNISKEVWEALQPLFLFIKKPKATEIVEVTSGRVLLAPEYRGKIYSKGLYVTTLQECEAGYDLDNLQLDRDRKMIDEWAVRGMIAELWNSAHAAEPEKFAPRVYDMVKRGTLETKNMTWRADDKLLKGLHEEFKKEHGEDAVPVSDMHESRELTELGAKPVIVDRTLKELLEKTAGTSAAVKEKLRGAVHATHDWGILTPEETLVCTDWIEKITKNYLVVDFNDSKVKARLEGDKVAVARSLLSEDPRTLVRHVVREAAKLTGRDLDEIYLDLVFST